MLQLKSCPRCGGDILREELLGEADLACLQCGYRAPARPQPRVPAGRALARRGGRGRVPTGRAPSFAR